MNERLFIVFVFVSILSLMVECSEELVAVSSVIDCLMAAISEFVAALLLSFEVVRLSILSLMALNDCSFNVLCSSREVLMAEISSSWREMSSFSFDVN